MDNEPDESDAPRSILPNLQDDAASVISFNVWGPLKNPYNPAPNFALTAVTKAGVVVRSEKDPENPDEDIKEIRENPMRLLILVSDEATMRKLYFDLGEKIAELDGK